MSYKVKIENFEGPFDLLLQLVSDKKLDIGSISITNIIDQYLEQVAHLQQVDLDVASDFMVVAASLLKIKTDMLLKLEPDDIDEDLEEMSPSEARNVLASRLLAYKQYKDASDNLDKLQDEQCKLFPRNAGWDSSFSNLMPNFLENVKLDQLAQMAAGLFANRDEFLLDAAHIAAKPIPVVTYVKTIYTRIINKKKCKFSDLIDASATPQIIVVNFLAMLELYKNNFIELKQTSHKSDIEIKYIEGSGELDLSNIQIDEE